MAEFDPVPPPLNLPAVPDVLSPEVPLNPPMVGFASPFQHVDSENRDIILESIRTWVWRNLLPWTTSWQDQLTAWETAEEDQLNAWMTLVDAYITAHAISGYSFRVTATAIAGSGTTEVVFANVDQDFRPVVVGDLVLDESIDGNFGIVTAIIDPTHATVSYVGSLRGPQGVSWRETDTDIAGSGTTNVVLAAPFYLGDFVLTTLADGNWGVITALIDSTHATVTFAGTLRGPDGQNGLSWRVTATPIAGAGTTNVTFSGVPAPPLQLGDIVTDNSSSGNVATITVLIDSTHATVTYLENLKGAPGTDGIMSSIVAGANITVDSTDPANPIVSSTGNTIPDLATFIALGTDNTEVTGGITWVTELPAAYALRSPGSPLLGAGVIYASSSYTSQDLLAQLTAHIDEATYAYVFIEMPYNDYANTDGLTVAEIVDATTQMIRLCEDRGITVIILDTPYWDHSLSTFDGSIIRQERARAAISNLTSLRGVPLVELSAKVPVSTDTLVSGGPLTSTQGRNTWAACIAATLTSMAGIIFFDRFNRPAFANNTLNPSLSGHLWQSLGTSVWTLLDGSTFPHFPTPECGSGGLRDMCVIDTGSTTQFLSSKAVSGQGDYVLRNSGVNGEGYVFDLVHGTVDWYLGGSSGAVGTFTPITVGQQFEIEVDQETIGGVSVAVIRVFYDDTPILVVSDTNIPAANPNTKAGLSNGSGGSGAGAWGSPLSIETELVNFLS
jgi:hypothetical protein